MAVAYVNRTVKSATGSGTTLDFDAANHTTGNLIVVLAKWEGGDTTVSVADTAGNTYTPLTKEVVAASGSDLCLQFFYAKNITGGASNVVTITWDSARTWKNCGAFQYSGADTTSPSNGEITGEGSGTPSITTSTFSRSADGITVCGAGEYAEQTGYTPGTGWDERWDGPVDSSTYGTAYEDKQHVASDTFGGAMTQSHATGAWGAVAAAFKVAGAAGGDHPAMSRWRGVPYMTPGPARSGRGW